MTVTINGTTGIAGVEGSAGTPAVQGGDTNTGMFFPAADTIAFSEGGAEAMRINSSGNVGIGTSSPAVRLQTQGGRVRFDANSENFALQLNNSTTANGPFLGSAGADIFVVSASSGAERMRIDSSGNLLFNSGYGSVATAYGCRAWVNFDGTGTPAVRASGNVSSIGDNGVGNYTVNFSTALPDINYSAVASVTSQGSVNSNTNCVDVFASAGGTRVAPTTSAFRLFVFHPGNQVAQDALYITASVFR